jgi:hypothetical protein
MDILANAADASQTTHGIATALRSLPSFRDKTYAQASQAYQVAYQQILKNIWDQRPYDVDLARKVLS